jgi:hypothetical protein
MTQSAHIHGHLLTNVNEFTPPLAGYTLRSLRR